VAEDETDFWNFAETAATGGNVEVQKHGVLKGRVLEIRFCSFLFRNKRLLVFFLEQHDFVDFFLAAPQRGVRKT